MAQLMTQLAPSTVPLTSAALAGVYFIQRGDDGPFKIGWSKAVRSRLAALQTASPERLHLRLVVGGQPADELRLHAWFAKERLVGEWFRPDGEVGEFVASAQARANLIGPSDVDTGVIRYDFSRDPDCGYEDECWGRIYGHLALATGNNKGGPGEFPPLDSVDHTDRRPVAVRAGDLAQILRDVLAAEDREVPCSRCCTCAMVAAANVEAVP